MHVLAPMKTNPLTFLPMTNPLSKSIVVAVATLAATALTASATVSFDLRATLLNGVAVSDPKNVTIDVGSLIVLELYAIVAANPDTAALEGYTSFVGGTMLSSAGGNIFGNFETPTNITPFRSSGSGTGLLKDLDGDGDIDLGNDAAVFTQGEYISVRSADGVEGNPSGLGASEFRLFRTSFRVTQLVNPSSTSPITLTFGIKNFAASGNEVIYTQEGALVSLSEPTAANGVFILSPVSLAAIPEPSAFGMVLLGAMGMVGFRRLSFRRS